MPFLILANPRPDRPHAKHSNRDRGAGRVERGQSQTFREAWRPRGFGRMHRPDARQRLDGVVTKAESLRDDSCACEIVVVRRGRDAAFPVVALGAQPKHGKHLCWGRDLGVETP